MASGLPWEMGVLGNVPTCLDQRQTTRWCPSLVVYGRCYYQWVRVLSILRPGLHPHVVLTAGRDHPSVTPGVLTDIWTCAYSTQSFPLLGPGAATGSLRAASSRVKHCPPDTDIWDCPPAVDGEAVGTASANLSCDLRSGQRGASSRHCCQPPWGLEVACPGACGPLGRSHRAWWQANLQRTLPPKVGCRPMGASRRSTVSSQEASTAAALQALR